MGVAKLDMLAGAPTRVLGQLEMDRRVRGQLIGRQDLAGLGGELSRRDQ
jgi:hypothetical protein